MSSIYEKLLYEGIVESEYSYIIEDCKFDESDRIRCKLYFFDENRMLRKQINTYDSDEHMIETMIPDYMGNGIDDVFLYDKNGYLIRQIMSFADDWSGFGWYYDDYTYFHVKTTIYLSYKDIESIHQIKSVSELIERYGSKTTQAFRCFPDKPDPKTIAYNSRLLESFLRAQKPREIKDGCWTFHVGSYVLKAPTAEENEE